MKKKKNKISQSKTAFINKDLHYELLKNLMDNIPDVIYFKDKKGRLILVNKAHAKGLGLKPEEVVGKTDFDIFPRKRAKEMQRDDLYVMKTGKPIIDKIERATRADGVDNYVSTTKIPRYNKKGEIVGLMGITRDITARIQIDKLQQEKEKAENNLKIMQEINQQQRDFFSAVSHELRTPLAVIYECTNLLGDEVCGKLNKKQKEVILMLKDNTSRLMKIVNDLLDISRLERGKFHCNFSLVDMLEILQDIGNFFSKKCKEKKIIFKLKVPYSETVVFADKERISQVISNLLDNAIKFTPPGGRIVVNLKKEKTHILVGVIDNGVGISAEEKSKIFDKFFQTPSSVTASQKGLGLGLNIAKNIIQRHKGEIWVESSPGVGSKFYFSLPLYMSLFYLGKYERSFINDALAQEKTVVVINIIFVNYQSLSRHFIGNKSLFRENLKKDIIKFLPRKFKIDKKEKVSISCPRKNIVNIAFSASCNVKLNITPFLEYLKRYLSSKISRNIFIKDNKEISLNCTDELCQLNLERGQLIFKEIYIGEETRKEERFPYQERIVVSLPGKGNFSYFSSDISSRGMMINCDSKLKNKKEVILYLPRGQNRPFLSLKATPIWIKKDAAKSNKDLYSLGLKFTNLTSKEKKLLSSFIRRIKNTYPSYARS